VGLGKTIEAGLVLSALARGSSSDAWLALRISRAMAGECSKVPVFTLMDPIARRDDRERRKRRREDSPWSVRAVITSLEFLSRSKEDRRTRRPVGFVIIDEADLRRACYEVARRWLKTGQPTLA